MQLVPHSIVLGVVHHVIRSTIGQTDSHETTTLRDDVHVDDVRRAARVIRHHHTRYVVVVAHRNAAIAIVHSAATPITASAIKILDARSKTTRASAASA